MGGHVTSYKAIHRHPHLASVMSSFFEFYLLLPFSVEAVEHNINIISERSRISGNCYRLIEKRIAIDFETSAVHLLRRISCKNPQAVGPRILNVKPKNSCSLYF